jgi:hypothetical protein
MIFTIESYQRNEREGTMLRRRGTRQRPTCRLGGNDYRPGARQGRHAHSQDELGRARRPFAVARRGGMWHPAPSPHRRTRRPARGVRAQWPRGRPEIEEIALRRRDPTRCAECLEGAPAASWDQDRHGVTTFGDFDSFSRTNAAQNPTGVLLQLPNSNLLHVRQGSTSVDRP